MALSITTNKVTVVSQASHNEPVRYFGQREDTQAPLEARIQPCRFLLLSLFPSICLYPKGVSSTPEGSAVSQSKCHLLLFLGGGDF